MDNEEYLRLFIEESQEHLQALNDNLLILEQRPSDLEIINIIFRSAHTLKGMAGAMQFERMAHLTHEMESRLDDMRSGQMAVTDDAVNVLFQSLDVLQRQLDEIIASGSDKGIDISGIVAQIGALGGKAVETHQATETALTRGPEVEAAIQNALANNLQVYTVEVTIEPESPMVSVRGFMVKRAYEEICDVLWSNPADPTSEAFTGVLTLIVACHFEAETVRQAGYQVLEVASVDVSVVQTANVEAAATATTTSTDPRQTAASTGTTTPAKTQHSKSVRVDVDRLDTLMNLYSEFIIDKTRLEQLVRGNGNHALQETVQHLARVGTDLQDIIMKIRMMPLDSVFNRFPRMIRDLSKALGKKVNFEVFGADTEIDRVLADEIADPLVHILRNSMDHGLERPDVRSKNGKSEMGLIRLSAYRAGNHVFIEIVDDGAGINREKVLQKAVKQGLVSAHDAPSMSDDEVNELLFHSGFSTADQVSDISGRGVGLDAVKSKIQTLSGDVSVSSVPGDGTTFVIRLPLTVSILSAMLVTVGSETFAIPTNSILSMDKLSPSQISTSQGQTLWDYRGRWIPLVYLKDLLSIPASVAKKEIHVAVLSRSDKLLAIAVDGFIGQQEVVLKSLGAYLNGTMEGISGATILGDGTVALIIDPNPFIH